MIRFITKSLLFVEHIPTHTYKILFSIWFIILIVLQSKTAIRAVIDFLRALTFILTDMSFIDNVFKMKQMGSFVSPTDDKNIIPSALLTEI